MRVISLFAGIGGFDAGFARSGMRTVAVIERDKNCLKLLKSRFPEAVQFDDVRTVGKHNLPECDLICGGSPCQDVSCAGKRAGLKGERSGLFFEFIRVIGECKPKYVVFENVPGLLSSNKGRDFERVLDEFEDLGYLYDVNMLDAQFFGVSQRRKRIFIVCRKISDILNEKTTSSALITLQCVAEILALNLVVLSGPSNPEYERLACDVSKPELSLKKRMKLFCLENPGAASKLRESFDVLRLQSDKELEGSESNLGLNLEKEGTNTKDVIKRIVEGGLGVTEGSSRSIDLSWNNIWEDVLEATKEYTTSTSTRWTTELKIYLYAKATAYIASFITQSMCSSPCFWSAASSTLIALRGYINYAQQASRDMFKEEEWVCLWSDFIRTTDPLCATIGNFTIEGFGEVRAISEGMRGDPPSCREEGKEVAGTLESRSRAGGFPGTDGACAGHVIPFDTTQITHPENRSKPEPGSPCHSLARQGHAPAIAFSCKDSGTDASEDLSPTLRSMNFDKSHLNGGGQVAVAFKPSHYTRGKDGAPSETMPPLSADADKGDQDPVIFQSRIARNGRGQPEDVCPALNGSNAGATSDMRPLVAASTMVRRLTPVECERLQGFPDGWTDGFSDSVRYRMLGNAVCVNVAEWIGKRIMRFAKEKE